LRTPIIPPPAHKTTAAVSILNPQSPILNPTHKTTAASTREAAGNGHQVVLGRFVALDIRCRSATALVATSAASDRGVAAAAIAAGIAARMERVTQAAEKIAQRPWAAAAIVARIAAGGRLAARSGLTARSRFAARVALRLASGLAASEEIAKPVSALRSTAIIATARGRTAAAAVHWARSVAGIRVTRVAVRPAGLELLHELGFSRICDQQHCGHRNGE
jgi:hypothetical protein